MYLNRGRKGNKCMVFPCLVFYIAWILTVSELYYGLHIRSSYCVWICTIHTCARWLQSKISACMNLPVCTKCLHRKHYRMRALPTRTVLITLDRYFFLNLAPTHHTHVSEISHCSKQCRKKYPGKMKMHRRILPALLFSYFPI